MNLQEKYLENKEGTAMWFALGALCVIGDCIAVKLFDDVIRPYTYRKAIVNAVMIAGLIMLIGGFIALLIK